MNTVVMHGEWSIMLVNADVEGLHLRFYGGCFLGKFRVYSGNGDLGNSLGNGVIRAPSNRPAGGRVPKEGEDDAVRVLAGDLPMVQVFVLFVGEHR